MGDIVVTYDAVRNRILLDFQVDSDSTVAMQLPPLGDDSGISCVRLVFMTRSGFG
jgi:hypothetical protein